MNLHFPWSHDAILYEKGKPLEPHVVCVLIDLQSIFVSVRCHKLPQTALRHHINAMFTLQKTFFILLIAIMIGVDINLEVYLA